MDSDSDTGFHTLPMVRFGNIRFFLHDGFIQIQDKEPVESGVWSRTPPAWMNVIKETVALLPDKTWVVRRDVVTLDIGEGRSVPCHCKEWTLTVENGRVVAEEQHVFFSDHGSMTVDALRHVLNAGAGPSRLVRRCMCFVGVQLLDKAVVLPNHMPTRNLFSIAEVSTRMSCSLALSANSFQILL